MTSAEKHYYDLHVTGLGYLSRIRQFHSNAEDHLIACDNSALCGWADDPRQRRFNVTASGPAQDLILQCRSAVDAGRKVQIGVCFSDVLKPARTRFRQL